MDFKEHIKTNKPNISEGTLKTYNSLLKTIYKNSFGDHKNPDLRNFKKTDEVLKFLNEKPYNARKTYFSALVCIEPDEPIYKKLMMGDIEKYNDNIEENKSNPKLDASTITTNEIEKIAGELKNNFDLLLKKKSLTIKDLMEMQNYIIMCLYHGFIVPRRSLDYVNMKFSNYDKETDNYIDLKKNIMVFNRFKTDKVKGQQSLDVPLALKKIIQKWISIVGDKTDYLLFNKKYEPLTSITLNQRLNSIFGSKKSVNSLRHYYLTNKYKKLMEENEMMGDDMEKMGSSNKQAKVYVKVN
jgi:hypothetical protein